VSVCGKNIHTDTDSNFSVVHRPTDVAPRSQTIPALSHHRACTPEPVAPPRAGRVHLAGGESTVQ